MEVMCPKCGSKTRLGTRSKDDRQYHVCIRYPQCRGMVKYDEEWGSDWDTERSETKTTHDRLRQQQNNERETVVADRQVAVNRGLKWGPTCLGALVTIALQLLVVLLVQTADPDMSHTPYFVIIAVTIVVSYFGGGLLAGAMTRGKGMSHGILSGFIAWAMCLILAQITWGFYGGSSYDFVIWGQPIDKSYFFIVYLLVGLLAALGFGAFGGFSGAKFREHWK